MDVVAKHQVIYGRDKAGKANLIAKPGDVIKGLNAELAAKLIKSGAAVALASKKSAGEGATKAPQLKVTSKKKTKQAEETPAEEVAEEAPAEETPSVDDLV